MTKSSYFGSEAIFATGSGVFLHPKSRELVVFFIVIRGNIYIMATNVNSSFSTRAVPSMQPAQPYEYTESCSDEQRLLAQLKTEQVVEKWRALDPDFTSGSTLLQNCYRLQGSKLCLHLAQQRMLLEPEEYVKQGRLGNAVLKDPLHFQQYPSRAERWILDPYDIRDILDICPIGMLIKKEAAGDIKSVTKKTHKMWLVVFPANRTDLTKEDRESSPLQGVAIDLGRKEKVKDFDGRSVSSILEFRDNGMRAKTRDEKLKIMPNQDGWSLYEAKIEDRSEEEKVSSGDERCFRKLTIGNLLKQVSFQEKFWGKVAKYLETNPISPRDFDWNEESESSESEDSQSVLSDDEDRSWLRTEKSSGLSLTHSQFQNHPVYPPVGVLPYIFEDDQPLENVYSAQQERVEYLAPLPPPPPLVLKDSFGVADDSEERFPSPPPDLRSPLNLVENVNPASTFSIGDSSRDFKLTDSPAHSPARKVMRSGTFNRKEGGEIMNNESVQRFSRKLKGQYQTYQKGLEFYQSGNKGFQEIQAVLQERIRYKKLEGIFEYEVLKQEQRLRETPVNGSLYGLAKEINIDPMKSLLGLPAKLSFPSIEHLTPSTLEGYRIVACASPDFWHAVIDPIFSDLIRENNYWVDQYQSGDRSHLGRIQELRKAIDNKSDDFEKAVIAWFRNHPTLRQADGKEIKRLIFGDLNNICGIEPVPQT